MRIKVNGQEESLEQEIRLTEFLKSKGLELDRLVIEYNKRVVNKEEWEEILLKDQDSLEVLRFVGGG
ncbi:sulfur carrier protein [Orenia metallireducens]|uniref:Sulfur carrier protein n=1 Tax=Orenia metallireducens TaxID=1413210 RepID=A0A285FWU2_9FIRM|nr:sulfur carrier protein ThiS [Orenia metallireducens]PRX35636.1 sulfur carrier protein [Orenia metallireducens]SNY15583.1 sulfur carrier protein [Orenia metallireducens]